MNDTPHNNLLGIGFILLTCLTMTASALLIRTIGKDLSTFQVVLIRCSFSLFYILLLHARPGTKLFTSPRPLMLTFRSLLLSVLVLGNFYAILHLPLVQFTALQFTKPLFLVILAALFLSERIRLPRTMATLIGFIGILVILRPDGDIQSAQLIVLIAALSTAAMTVITKKMTKDHTPNSLVFYGNLFVVLVCIGPTITYWQTPSLFRWVMIAG
ncbi:MAG: DMT family transporter, partial [Emcibacter sp.]|nr:DMT family transporter [Emcibacter sp.]